MAHYAQCTRPKLVSAVPQRWSGVCSLLEAIIVNWDAIDAMYSIEGKKNPLAEWRSEIAELYSLIKPCAEFVVECQQTTVPTGQAAVLGLAALKLSTLNLKEPLDILTPQRKLPARGTGEPACAGRGEQNASSEPRDHVALSPVCRRTRDLLLAALNQRWFDRRYGSEEDEGTGLLFDMQNLLHPTTADLVYVDRLADTEARAAQVKQKIVDKVVALAVKLAQEAAKEEADDRASPPEKRKREADPPGGGRTHQAPLQNGGGSDKQVATAAKWGKLGLYHKVDTTSEPPPPPALEQQVADELAKLRASSAGSLMAELSCGGILSWWKKWAFKFPLLSRVARVVFGAPASAGMLERDFGGAVRSLNSSRSRTDAAYVEMILFLHGNLDLIPVNIPKLDADGENGVQCKIPGRLMRPDPELDDLCGPAAPLYPLSRAGDEDAK